MGSVQAEGLDVSSLQRDSKNIKRMTKIQIDNNSNNSLKL